MNEWYKDWFNSDEYLLVYKHRNEADADKLLRLIFDNILIKQGSKILDAACGAGRHSIQLAQRGFDVTGFDLSDTLLKVARKNLNGSNLKVNFIKADIRHFYSKEAYNLILNLFTSFGYFDSDDENFQFYVNAFSMMEDKGYLVFDYFNSNYISNNLVPESKKTINDMEVTEKRFIIGNRVNKTINIKKDGIEKTFTESVKLYSYKEIVKRFEEIGFVDLKIFGDFEGNKFDENRSQRLIIICQK